MNKVVSINLNGIIISIDEVAYERLKRYIDALHQHFTGTEGAGEIISDIESRIAELLQLKLTDTYTVIQVKDVEDVIAIMGNPWEMASENTEEHQEKQSSRNATGEKANPRKLKRDPHNKVVGGVCSGIGNYFGLDPIIARAAFLVSVLVFGSGVLLYIILWAIMPEASPDELPQFSGNATRRLYRNPDNKVLGGVCSGAAAYIGIDEVWIRIGFAISVFVFGTGVLAYFVLWIIIPEAKTSAEKLQMRGSNVDVNTIEREVRSAATNLSNRASGISPVLKTLLKIAGVVIGIGLFFSVVLPGSIGLVFLTFIMENSGDLSILLKAVTINDTIFYLAKFGMMGVIGSVVLGITVFVLRLFIKFKLRHLSVISSVLFVGGVVMCVMAGVKYGGEIDEEATVVDEERTLTCNDTLLISVNDVLLDEDAKRFDVEIDHEEVDWAIAKDRLFLSRPRLRIKTADGKRMQVKVKREARGSSHDDAEAFAKDAMINIEADSSHIRFDNKINTGKVYKHQEVSIGLWIPEGKVLKVERDALRFLHDFDASDYDYDELHEKPFQYFKVTEKGLRCLSCEKADWADDKEVKGDDDDHDHEARIEIEEVVTDSTSHNGKVKVVKKTKRVGPVVISETEKTEHK